MFHSDRTDLVAPTQKTTEIAPGNPIEEFGRAFAYGAIQNPINGIVDAVDHVAGTKLLPKVQLIEAPVPEKPFSIGWHAEQLGNAAGMLVPFLAIRKGLGASGLNVFSAENASTRMLLAQSATTGFLMDSMLRPGDPTSQGASYWLGRAGAGVVGAATFAAFTGVGVGLKGLAANYEGTLGSSLLKNNIVAGALAGLPIGLASTEIQSRIDTGHDASLQQLGEGAYAMTLVGGALGGLGQLGEQSKSSFSFEKSFQDLKAKGQSIRGSLAWSGSDFNPFMPQLALAGMPEGMRANVFESRAVESRAAEYGRGTSDTTSGERESRRASKGSGTNSVDKVLSRSTETDFRDAYKILSEQHPEDFAGLRSARHEPLASGQDAVAIELMDGKYRNAVLRIMGLPETDPEGRPYMDWDKEWGYRPYDAKLLSDVAEVRLPGGKQMFAFVQEKVDALGGGKDVDLVQDATFANLSNEPQFDALMAQLEARGERFVDPGSRQLGYDKNGKLVVIDYPSIRRSSEPRPSDSPEDLAAHVEDGNQPELPEDHGFTVDDNVASREDFLYKKPGNPSEAMRQEIGSMILDGSTDREIIPTIEWLYKDLLAEKGIDARRAVSDTHVYLKKIGLN